MKNNPVKNVLIIHGSDTSASRNALYELRRKYADTREIISLSAGKFELTDLIQAVESPSLFSGARMVIIENLFGMPKSSVKDKLIGYISSSASAGNTDIILWESKEVDKKNIQKFLPGAQVQLFNYPLLLFRFLDSLGTNTRKNTIDTFHSLLKEKEAELVFVMLQRQFRYLIIAGDLGEKGLYPMPPWQAGKFVRQSRFFPMEKLLSLYRELLAIDLRIKSSSSPLTLAQQLDIFLLSI